MSKPNTLPSVLPRSRVPQLLHDRAVQFGGAARENGVKAYPFIYNFIGYPYQQGIQNPDTGTYSITGVDAEGPDGLAIAAGGILDVPIVMDNDLPYHLLYTHYGAYYQTGFTAALAEGALVTSSNYVPLPNVPITFTSVPITPVPATTIQVGVPYYPVNYVVGAQTTFSVSNTIGGAPLSTDGATGDWVFVVNGGAGGGTVNGSRERLLFPGGSGTLTSNAVTLFNSARNCRIPYWTELDVSVYFPSSGGRDLYGGFQRSPILGATEENPIPLLNLQGAQDGLGMLKTPYQLPKAATVWLRFRSRSAFPLRVYGMLFGYKITI